MKERPEEAIRIRQDVTNKKLQKHHGASLMYTFTLNSYELEEVQGNEEVQGKEKVREEKNDKDKGTKSQSLQADEKEIKTEPKRLKSPTYTKNKSPEENLEERRRIFQNIIDTRIESYTIFSNKELKVLPKDKVHTVLEELGKAAQLSPEGIRNLKDVKLGQKAIISIIRSLTYIKLKEFFPGVKNTTLGSYTNTDHTLITEAHRKYEEFKKGTKNHLITPAELEEIMRVIGYIIVTTFREELSK